VTKKTSSCICALIVSLSPFFAFAAGDFKLQTVKILGTRETYVEPGSIYQFSEEDLKNRKTTNIHEVLKDVPGVSIQQEDGLGLRPNIGLRGTHPHRSKKITLLEDGVLLGPAPYSAPAAYYFPFFSKITGVEIYKGPSSVKYGPNSIGGAINLITRDFAQKNTTELDYSIGSFDTHKFGAWQSGSSKSFKWLAEYNRASSEGFKELPGGGNTGFEKNDLLLKSRYTFNTEKERSLDFKFSWSAEVSNETYMGLTADDFSANPYTRYEASRADRLDWENRQYQIKYFNEWSENIFSDLTVYRSEFSRTWDKLNGFADTSIDMRDVFLSPVGQNADFLAVLKGEKDSSPSEKLRFGINARDYVSEGVSLETRFTTLNSGSSSNHLDLGILFHSDEIERSHLLQDADIIGGRLSKDTAFADTDNSNIDSTNAFRLFLSDTFENKKFLLRLGGRFERVTSKRFNKKDQALENTRTQDFFVPGAGLSYKLDSKNLIFVGANRGYTLPGPGSQDQIDPEEAWNYEFGYRHKGAYFVELIGFYSDYKNILGTCSFSTGCTVGELDVQFNGGEAIIYGAEFLAGTEVTYKEVSMPIRLSATYTNATFDSSILSTNREWGGSGANPEPIIPGDPLPYIPEFMGSINVGLKYKKITSNLFYNIKSRVFDQAAANGRIEIPSFSTLNLNTRVQVNPKLGVYLNVENLLGEEYISSARPFGLRPGAPRWVSMGATYRFGG